VRQLQYQWPFRLQQKIHDQINALCGFTFNPSDILYDIYRKAMNAREIHLDSCRKFDGLEIQKRLMARSPRIKKCPEFVDRCGIQMSFGFVNRDDGNIPISDIGFRLHIFIT
jgi:hypothetical protein